MKWFFLFFALGCTADAIDSLVKNRSTLRTYLTAMTAFIVGALVVVLW